MSMATYKILQKSREESNMEIILESQMPKVNIFNRFWIN